MGQHFFQDRGRDRIARRNETVVHPPPLAPRGDDARAAEIRQVTRDFWLAHPEDLHKVADANLLVGHQVEETQPRAIGQGAKEEIERERFFLPGHTRIIYGLTDMSKEAYLKYIRTSVCVFLLGGPMAMESVKARKAHVAIHVKDVGASIEFYGKLFGIEPCKVRTGYAKFDVANPPLNFTLNEATQAGQGALSHLGIQVESTADVLAVRQSWRERGLLPRDEMKTECCYALQDKAWVRDPDGNEWEVFAVLEDNLPEKPVAEKSCCAPDCCAPDTP